MLRFGWLIAVLTPTFSQALCLWLGLLAVVFTPLSWGWLGLAGIVLLLMLAACGLPFRQRGVLPVLFVVLVGRFLFAAFDYQANSEQRLALHDQKLTVTGEVTELISQDENRQLFLFRPNIGALEGQLLRISWYRSAIQVALGEQWRLPIKLKAPRSFSTPGGMDYELWFYRQGWLANAYVTKGGTQRLQQSHGRSDGVRATVAARFNQALHGETYRGALLALATADKSGIGPEHWESFRRLGLSHLLAISGLHIGIVAALGFAFGRGAWRCLPIKSLPRPQVQLTAAIFFAAAYAGLADWALPTQRAFIMLLALALPSFLYWSVSVWQRLAMALAAVLLWNPWAVLSPGFYLSFYAVAVLLLAATNRDKPASWLGWLLALFRLQCWLFVALAPLTVAAFHELPLASLLANLVMIPLFSLILVPGVLLAVLLSLVTSGGLLAEWLWLLHALLEVLMSAFDYLGLVSWRAEFPATAYALLALAMVSITLAIVPWPLRLRALLCAGLLPMFFLSPSRPDAGELWVTMLDVGQGQALHIQTADGNWLYDTGPKLGSVDAGSLVIEPYLRQLGLVPDSVFVSHDDNDHAGGLAYLQLRYPGMHLEPCVEGRRWQSGKTEFRMLHPPVGYLGSDNNESCVLLMQLGAHKLLLTGDIEAQVERSLVKRYPALLADVDVITVPHHGSGTSSSRGFLDLTRPSVALLSVGWRNRFGHPKADVLARYENVAAQVYRSDTKGSTMVKLRLEGLASIESYRENPFRPWWR